MPFLQIHRSRIILLTLLLFPCLLQPQKAAAELFPRYPEIEKNIKFWEDIYTKYSIQQAVIHDANDLSIVYTVVELVDPLLPGIQKINALAQKQVIKKYEGILYRLSRQAPSTPLEKRVAARFSGKSAKRAMQRAAQNVRSQRGQKDRFVEGVIASGAYLAEMKRIFREYGLPEDLVYLAHVESSFNLQAHSKQGAAGIWQFTRGTGKKYLRIDRGIDERRDPILATHAAAKYLKKSYQRLGSWPLAITSYNYGLSGMLRARKEYGSYTEIFKNYRKGYFKFASKNFYSEFLAARAIAKKLEKVLKINTPEKTISLKLPAFVDLGKLSRYLGLTKERLCLLNPALKSATIRGERYLPRGYSLRLPADPGIRQKMAHIPASLLYKRQRQQAIHEVRRGETAIGIAKRYGISLKSLLRLNNLDHKAQIYTNQKLHLPHNTVSPQTMTTRTRQKKIPVPTLVGTRKNRPYLNNTAGEQSRTTRVIQR